MWYQINNQSVSLCVKVKPNASKNAILGVKAGFLQITLQPPPADGAANKMLLNLLAKKCHIAKTTIELVRGTTSRQKIVKLPLTDSVKKFLGEIEINPLSQKQNKDKKTAV